MPITNNANARLFSGIVKRVKQRYGKSLQQEGRAASTHGNFAGDPQGRRSFLPRLRATRKAEIRPWHAGGRSAL